MINLFAIFVSEDSEQLLFCLYVAIFKFYVEKCPKDEEDAEVGNYADLHHHILSDALQYREISDWGLDVYWPSDSEVNTFKWYYDQKKYFFSFGFQNYVN